MSRFDELKVKVLSLPYEAGVYIMKNKAGEVIYVGKAKALKNRVSQYFGSDTRHSPKTKVMVSNIWDFEIIVTESEFEALVLENAMIKKYKPKYNILLKDDKGYPFIKVSTSKPFPEFEIVSAPKADKDRYFGPYLSRGAAKQAIDTISETLKLKTCRRIFPRDIGKARPCLNKHLGRCIAPCTGDISQEDYKKLIDEGIELLQGNDKSLLKSLNNQMQIYAEDLNFERAAIIRDRIKAIEGLNQKQKVVAGSFADLDVVSFVQGQTKGCVVVLHYLGGSLQDKEYTIIDGVGTEDISEVLSAFLKQYYSLRKVVPKTVLLNHEIEDIEIINQFLSAIAGKNIVLSVPKRGKRHDLVRLAEKNASEEISRTETKEQRYAKSLELLQNITGVNKKINDNIIAGEIFKINNVQADKPIITKSDFVEVNSIVKIDNNCPMFKDFVATFNKAAKQRMGYTEINFTDTDYATISDVVNQQLVDKHRNAVDKPESLEMEPLFIIILEKALEKLSKK